MKVEALRAKPVSNLASPPRANTPSHGVKTVSMLISNLYRELVYDVEGPFLRWLYASSSGKINKKMRFPF
jgi:hypothetical protein